MYLSNSIRAYRRVQGTRFSASLPRRLQELSDDHSEDVLSCNRPVNPAVSGVHAVIAEEEKLVFAAHDELFLDFATGVGWHTAGQVRLIELPAIDVNRTVFQKNGIAADADDAFDRKAFG